MRKDKSYFKFIYRLVANIFKVVWGKGKQPVFVLILLGLFFTFAEAARVHQAAGSTSAAFLKLIVGARAGGMGGNAAAVCDDPSAVFANPAGLNRIRQQEVSAMHNQWFQDLQHDFLGYVYPRTRDVWGFGLTGLFYPKDLERRSGDNENIPEEPLTESEGSFGANDFAAGLSYGYQFNRSLSGGLNLKIIRQEIDNQSGTSVGLDAGFIARSPLAWGNFWRQISWGGAIRNFGPALKVVSRSYNLPLTAQLGMAWRPLKERMVFSLDLAQSIDNYTKVTAGGEYWFKQLALRAGYRYKLYGNDLGDLSGLSTGIGLRISNYQFDFAFLPQGILGNTYRFSLSARFGQKVEKESFRQKPVCAAAKVEEKNVLPDKQGSEAGNQKAVSKDIKIKPLRISPQAIESEVKISFDDPLLVQLSFLTRQRLGKDCPLNLALEQLPAPPEELNGLIGQAAVVHSVYKFDSPLEIKNSILHLKISKSWLAENKIMADKIVLYYTTAEKECRFLKLNIMEEQEDAFLYSVKIKKGMILVIAGEK
ncbi:MAG: PorV/PorQ family protein [Elusimicrobiota bacterium]